MEQPLKETTFFNPKVLVVVFVTLVSIKLWSFRVVPDPIYDKLEIGVLGLLFGLVFFYNRTQDTTTKLFQGNVQLFIWLPLVSAISALVFHDQSISLSLLILRTNFFWLLYFVLHLLNVPVKRVVQLMLVVGLVWIFITVVQQFTYPTAFFYNRTEEENYDFYRAGVYRFMIDQHQYGLFVIIYFFHRFQQSKKYGNLLLVFLGLVGYYYYSGRQYALAAAACLVLATFLQKGTFKIYMTLLMVAVGGVLYYFRDELFGEYIEMTNNQLNSDDEVRLLAARFYLFEYWPHWITTLIGNGYENYKSNYGKEILYINQVKLLFRSDVGIIGVLNMFGAFYVLNILWFNFKGLKNKFYHEDTSYLKYVFVNALLLLPLSEAYSVPSGAVPFFCMVLYLIDKSYEKKQLTTPAPSKEMVRYVNR